MERWKVINNRDKIYRVSITVQEFDHDGFWDVITSLQIAQSKEQLKESLENIYSKTKEYIEKRLV